MRKIVTITTEGGSREDGNVYYAKCILVESNTLQFNEPVFTGMVNGGDIPELEDDDESLDMEKVPDYLRSLGYTVHELDEAIITLNTGY